MVWHAFKILQQVLQDFKSVFDFFGTLCVKELTLGYVVSFVTSSSMIQ